MRSLCLLALALAGVLPAAAQPHSVHGRVTDASGEPLVGVHVVEAGTLNGTATGRDGAYALTLRSPDAVLAFSYVGYRGQEVAVAGRAELDVVLEAGVDLGDVVVVGTRNLSRSETDTPVAVDILPVAELASTVGQPDLNQLLQYAAPSFNANRQSGADGSDHVDPATLRGLGPDQTLVLVNGKRRHQSALINIFGSRGRGNTGTDLNAIPAAAIERIEILRDGASAQYGSDAIAGAVNIVLKSSTDELTAAVAGGAHQARFRSDREFDGETIQFSANYGVPVGSGGFVNVTGDFLTRSRTNRPADPTAYAIYRRQFGDAAYDNFSGFANAAVPLSDAASVYAFGGYSYRTTDAYAWTREPDSERNVPEIYPDGFDPRILSTVTDRSLSAGLRTRFHGWDADVNHTLGHNRFHYFVDGSLNASLLARSPTRFDAGGFELTQNTTGLDLSRFVPGVLSGLHVALGAEFRVERYGIFQGEEASWRNYGVVDSLIDGRVQQVDVLGRPGGSQGFPGFRPDNEVDETRSNLGAYLDLELDVTPRLLVAAAARAERYSDFGNTATGRLAARLRLTDYLALRASAGTGFRAPSLAQVHFNTTFTDFVGGVPVDKIIARNDSPITRALGIPALTEEKARNAGLGFTANLPMGLTATVDGYYVRIEDRIVLTGAFGDDDPDIGADLRALGVGAAQFFTNALDTETYGLDVILTYDFTVGLNEFRLGYAGNFNHMELGDVRTSAQLAGKEDVYFGRREQHFLLASAPSSKMNLSLEARRGRAHTTVRLVRFGEVTLIDWLDEEDVYEPRLTTDLSLGYDVTRHATLVLGGTNVFDVYPSQQDTETETGGLWDAVQMGFAGRYVYGRLTVRL